MPRPNKILEPTKTYNLLMKEEQFDKLAYVADLMREALDIYVEAYEEENGIIKNKTT